MSSRAIGAWERMGSSRWHGAASSALVSRSRAIPAAGRPSSPGGGAKPSPRLFSLTDVRCRALVGARCRCEHRRSLVNAPSGLSASRRGCIFHSDQAGRLCSQVVWTIGKTWGKQGEFVGIRTGNAARSGRPWTTSPVTPSKPRLSGQSASNSLEKELAIFQ